jgi:hypothetical protein
MKSLRRDFEKYDAGAAFHARKRQEYLTRWW